MISIAPVFNPPSLSAASSQAGKVTVALRSPAFHINPAVLLESKNNDYSSTDRLGDIIIIHKSRACQSVILEM